MNKAVNTIKNISMLTLVTAALVACGGGGGSDPTPTPMSSTPTPSPTTSTPVPTPTPSTLSDALDLSDVSVDAAASGLTDADWNRKANFMEIYIRGYKDSDGDGVGDIQGLIAQLDYLQALGITGIWLMPVHESSDNDHGYAVTDYRDIEDDYGTMEDFDELIAEAHSRGIGIIMDYVINHSSNQNPLFRDFASSPASDKRDWYIYSATQQTWGAFGNGWHSMPSGGGYYYGAFIDFMPDFNLANEEVASFHINNLRYWLNKGVDGFRFDAVGVLFENGSGQAVNQPENIPFMKRVQDAINEYDNRFIVCEAPDGSDLFAAENACGGAFAFGTQSNLLNTATSNALAGGLVSQLEKSIRDRMPLFLSNHDHFAGDRIGTQLSGNVADMKMAGILNVLLSSTPFTYYGEEVGISNGSGLSGDHALRTPMSWTDDADNAGFSTAIPFRALSANSTTMNVAAEEGVADSILETYRALYQLKLAHPVMSLGDFNLQSSAGENSLIFTRRDGTNGVAVLINLSTTAQDLTVLTGAADTAYTTEMPAGGAGGTTGDAASLGEVTVNVAAQSATVLAYADADIAVVVCSEPYTENAAGDGCDLPVSDTQPDPVVTAGANELVIFYKNDTDDYAGFELHIWKDANCDIYTDAQVAGVVWADGVDQAGIDPNYGAYWVLDIEPDAAIGDCGNFIIHAGDTKGVSNADLAAEIDADRIVYGVERYERVFPELWVLEAP